MTGLLIEGKISPPHRLAGKHGTKQEEQEEYTSMVEYIRTSPWLKRTSNVPESLQDLTTRL
jgi:hypothetical protein